jgi:hypothetical protein
MTTNSAIETMNGVLGANYQIINTGTSDPIVLAKLPDEDLAPKNSVTDSEPTNLSPLNTTTKPSEKTTDDYLFQVYLGSLTVVGLFVLFRMIQKSH